ncbi:MAG: glutathione S-transferase family protein [Hyphomonas sp.]
MVRLLDSEIRTREVLDWKGLHLFHAALSSCSQKTRIFLAEKGVSWESHPINIAANENISEYYLGINPRGLVPALVDDGEVHVESNDIILHIEDRFPEPGLVPTRDRQRVEDMLRHEDDLHEDIRNVTFRFLFEPPVSPKSPEDLARYGKYGSSTVGGQADTQKAKEISFWKNYGKSRVSDEAARKSVSAFRRAFTNLDATLQASPYLLGTDLSIVDIAWFIYANRLVIAGYPLADLHPNVNRWYAELLSRPGWAEEVALPPPLRPMAEHHQRALAQEKRRMVDICDLVPEGHV